MAAVDGLLSRRFGTLCYDYGREGNGMNSVNSVYVPLSVSVGLLCCAKLK